MLTFVFCTYRLTQVSPFHWLLFKLSLGCIHEHLHSPPYSWQRKKKKNVRVARAEALQIR